MEARNILKKMIAPAAIIILAVLSRLIPHPPNFAPIGGLALFSGATLNKKQAFAIPLVAMFVSDLFLGFHSTMLYVYGSFALIVFIGMQLKKIKFTNLLLASLISSGLFYLITNFGVWASTDLYPKNMNGLIQSYILALPFFKNTLLSDLFYTFSLFYGYKYLTIVLKRLYFIKN